MDMAKTFGSPWGFTDGSMCFRLVSVWLSSTGHFVFNLSCIERFLMRIVEVNINLSSAFFTSHQAVRALWGILMQGFFSFQVSEISPAIKLTLKLTGLRCLECSRWQIFFRWSFMVSMINLLPRRSLSSIGINLFSMLDLRLVIRSNSSSNSCSKSCLPRYPWSAKSLPVRPWHQFLTAVRSLTLPVVTLKARSWPTWLTIRWSWNPNNHPRLDFPLLARPLKTLFLGIGMFLPTAIGPESI